MRSYFVSGRGVDALELREVADPAPESGEVVVETRAVSLNFRDLKVAEGKYGKALERPMVPCSDAAGVVAEVGEGVRSLKVGDRVMNSAFKYWPAGPLRREYMSGFLGGGGVDGVLAERFVFRAGALVRVPDHLSFEEAATLPIAGLTAWSALVPFGQIRAGDWVLAHGTGGVSIFAAQLAKMMGARVILTTASAEKAAVVRERFRVEATFDYRDENWTKKVFELTGGNGVDIVVDTAGGATGARSAAACAYGARIAIVGVLDSEPAPMDTIRVLSRQLRIGGIYMDSVAEFESFARAVSSSKLKPAIDRVFPFEEARGAYAHLAAQKHIGKVVIRVCA